MADNNPDVKPFQVDKLLDQMKDPQGTGIISDQDRARISEKILSPTPIPEPPTLSNESQVHMVEPGSYVLPAEGYKSGAQIEAEKIFPNALPDDVLKAASVVDRGKVLAEDAQFTHPENAMGGLDIENTDKLTTFKKMYYYDKYLMPEMIQQIYGDARNSAKLFLDGGEFETNFYKKYDFGVFERLRDVGVLTENQRKVDELAEKTNLTPEQVGNFMAVRLAAAGQIQGERESRYPPGLVLRAMKKIKPDRFDIVKIIANEQEAVDRFLNEQGLESFHPPEGKEDDPKVMLWKDMLGSGQDLASQRPEYFGQTIDAYRTKMSLPPEARGNTDSPTFEAFRENMKRRLEGKKSE